MEKAKPFIIVGVFWMAIFLFVVAGYSGSFGVSLITGSAINESGQATPVGLQGIMILILFFTNIVTLFFLIRTHAKK